MPVTLSFGVDWENNGIYTDEAARVRSLSTRRGREYILTATGPQHMANGETWGEFNNHDRRFDAFYSSSPIYGNILPGRPARLLATVDGVTYPVFGGFLFDLNALGTLTGTANYKLVDGFSLLDLQKCQSAAAQPNYAVSDAIDDLLTQSAWPLVSSATVYPFTFPLLLGSTTIEDNGDEIVSFSPDTSLSILTQMHEIADAFGGALFVTRSGSLAYRSRNASRPTILTITDDGIEPEVGTRAPWPEIYNEIKVQPTVGAVQTASDATSQNDYFRRTMEISNNGIIQNTTHASNLANHYLAYAADVKRPLTVKMIGHYAAQFGLELMDRVRVESDRLNISATYTVGQIKHDWLGGGNVRTTFELEPDYFEVSGLGVYPFTFPITLGW